MARISRQILGFEEEADTRLAKALERDVQVCPDSEPGVPTKTVAPLYGDHQGLSVICECYTITIILSAR